MAERVTKGDLTKSKADTKSDLTTTGEPDTQGTIDQLRQGLDDLRDSVASLTAQVGEGARAASSRGLQMAGEVAEDVADRANEGVTALRSRIEDQPLASMAIAFFAGVAISGLVMGTLLAAGSGSRPQHQPNRRPSGRRS
jgi:hypothetical protein